ncbi:TetR family transcriptional regulator [Bifidobacterium anseris]|uniref:TetR family transcriptional regulator n=1 Tax=Bifidobacterium anseris TaxID=2020963 RepID=A0A2N5IXQ5_9BIFI|nr:MULTISPECIES: TetR/AcrR family transcriptional regulator [Bifidobacterium]PLS26734.1 TetR family transcriptional regulator [Bifidobacterium anseris]
MNAAAQPADGVRMPARHAERREQTDVKIMRATLEILIAQGIGAVTIEAVARKSGVAKTTIYRRFANSDDLIRHLAHTIALPIDLDGIEPGRAGLQAALRRIVDCFDEKVGLTAVGIVLSSSNERLREVADNVIRPVSARFAEFLARGATDGVFRGGLDAPFLFRTVLGSMLACKALGAPGNGSHNAWASHMTELLWPSVSA